MKVIVGCPKLFRVIPALSLKRFKDALVLVSKDNLYRVIPKTISASDCSEDLYAWVHKDYPYGKPSRVELDNRVRDPPGSLEGQASPSPLRYLNWAPSRNQRWITELSVKEKRTQKRRKRFHISGPSKRMLIKNLTTLSSSKFTYSEFPNIFIKYFDKIDELLPSSEYTNCKDPWKFSRDFHSKKGKNFFPSWGLFHLLRKFEITGVGNPNPGSVGELPTGWCQRVDVKTILASSTWIWLGLFLTIPIGQTGHDGLKLLFAPARVDKIRKRLSDLSEKSLL
jgi:hypothetical protein